MLSIIFVQRQTIAVWSQHQTADQWPSITGRTDRQTDGQTDRVRRIMRPPPREEGRIIIYIVAVWNREIEFGRSFTNSKKRTVPGADLWETPFNPFRKMFYFYFFIFFNVTLMLNAGIYNAHKQHYTWNTTSFQLPCCRPITDCLIFWVAKSMPIIWLMYSMVLIHAVKSDNFE